MERQKAQREATKECSFRPTIAGVPGRTTNNNTVNTERLSQRSSEVHIDDEDDVDMSERSEFRNYHNDSRVNRETGFNEGRRRWDIVDRNPNMQNQYSAAPQYQHQQREAVGRQDPKSLERFQNTHLSNRIHNGQSGYGYKPQHASHFTEDDSEVLSSAYELEYDMS